MGCGASKAAQVALSDQIRKGDVDLSNKELSSSERGEENGTQKERITQNGRDRVKENEGKSLDVTSRGEDGKHKELIGRPVAFDVTIGDEQPRKAPPRRLDKLEPVQRLTVEQLEEKQRAAEERKHKEIEKKRMSKRDKLHHDIAEARDMERSKQINEIETRMNSVEKKRIEQRQAIVEKQRQHDEHVQRVREKAKQLNSGESDLDDIAGGWGNGVEHDDTFNKESNDDETWWNSDVEKQEGDDERTENRDLLA